jgi:predicted DNA binding CopG/RHH family protein
MKVFYTATYKGAEKFSDQFKKIHTALEDLGYKLIVDPYLLAGEKYDDGMKDPQFAQKHFSEQINRVKSSDLCVFEGTYHSLGLGFLIKEAIEHGKPTIVLYYESYTPVFLSGIHDDKLVLQSYNDENYKEVLKECLDKAREKRDKRFNFFISPKLLEYLETASNEEGLTKSKFIRNLIVGHMRTNRSDEQK